MAIKERDVVLQGQDEQGNPTIDLPVTRLGNIEDSAEIKQAPAAGDFIPIMDGMDGGQMKKMPYDGYVRAGQKPGTTIGANATAEGVDTEASGSASHAEGMSTRTNVGHSHAEGRNTLCFGLASASGMHSEGYCTVATWQQNGFTVRSISNTDDGCSFTIDANLRSLQHIKEGHQVLIANGNGFTTLTVTEVDAATGTISVAETIPSGVLYKPGVNLSVITHSTFGQGAHAEGHHTLACHDGSHAEGDATIASGMNSHTEGCNTQAIGEEAHAEGDSTKASGNDSHSEGSRTAATGGHSHAEGLGTTASNGASHAGGKYNKAMATGGSPANTTGDAMVIGNGIGSSVAATTLSNAFRVTYAGEVYGLSEFKTTGADYAEYFEWQDGNPDNQDRVGYFVTLDGKHIRKAAPGDYILGIVSGQPCIIGNADEDWMGRWQHDAFGRFVKEYLEEEETEITPPAGLTENDLLRWMMDNHITQREDKYFQAAEKVAEHETASWRFKANSDYDASQPYVERRDRQEWDAVGMLGVLAVWDDGSCQAGGYCKVAAGGIATAADAEMSIVDGKIVKGYRVIKRVTDNIVKVVFR